MKRISSCTLNILKPTDVRTLAHVCVHVSNAVTPA